MWFKEGMLSWAAGVSRHRNTPNFVFDTSTYLTYMSDKMPLLEMSCTSGTKCLLVMGWGGVLLSFLSGTNGFPSVPDELRNDALAPGCLSVFSKVLVKLYLAVVLVLILLLPLMNIEGKITRQRPCVSNVKPAYCV